MTSIWVDIFLAHRRNSGERPSPFPRVDNKDDCRLGNALLDLENSEAVLKRCHRPLARETDYERDGVVPIFFVTWV